MIPRARREHDPRGRLRPQRLHHDDDHRRPRRGRRHQGPADKAARRAAASRNTRATSKSARSLRDGAATRLSPSCPRRPRSSPCCTVRTSPVWWRAWPAGSSSAAATSCMPTSTATWRRGVLPARRMGAGRGRRRRPRPASFTAFATTLGMTARVASSAHRPKVALFVSKADHCFHDLALRWRAGEFAGDFARVISNHADLAAVARRLRSALSPRAGDRPDQGGGGGAAACRSCARLGVELVVLARYMQVLSPGVPRRHSAGR